MTVASVTSKGEVTAAGCRLVLLTDQLMKDG
jgi:hypothetical protein